MSFLFENFIILIIILSSIYLCIDTPLLSSSKGISKMLFGIDICFTIIFTFEAIIKITALGFFSSSLPHTEGYIKNHWNALDFFVVVVSLIDLFIELTLTDMIDQGNKNAIKGLRSLRAIRAMRPLRVVK